MTGFGKEVKEFNLNAILKCYQKAMGIKRTSRTLVIHCLFLSPHSGCMIYDTPKVYANGYCGGHKG